MLGSGGINVGLEEGKAAGMGQSGMRNEGEKVVTQNQEENHQVL
jgi:hypothetical protein